METTTITHCPDCGAEIDITVRWPYLGHYDEQYGPPEFVGASLYETEEDGCLCEHSQEKLLEIALDQLQADGEAEAERRQNI